MLPSLKARHQQFIRERRYLHNVSPATVRWYTHAFKWLSLCASPEDPSQDELNTAVCHMREKSLKATGANAAIRAINAYLHWNSKSTRKCGGRLHASQSQKKPLYTHAFKCFLVRVPKVARRVERRSLPDARERAEGDRSKRSHSRHQRLSSQEQQEHEKVRRRLHTSESVESQRTVNRLADVLCRSSQVAGDVET